MRKVRIEKWLNSDGTKNCYAIRDLVTMDTLDGWGKMKDCIAIAKKNNWKVIGKTITIG